MTETLITDFEKSMALGAALLRKLRNIEQKLTEDDFIIDMYGADPGGVFGVITTRVGPNAAQLPRQYNGPIIIETIMATWGVQQSGASTTGSGTVTSPGALAVIAGTGFLPAGIYQVYVTFDLSGTVAAADTNNIRLISTGATPATIPLENNIGTVEQTFGPFEIKVTGLVGDQITLQAIGAGTVGSVYSGTVSATLVQGDLPSSVALTIADRTLQLLPGSGLFNPQGLKIQVARDDDITLTCTPAAPCSIEVMGYADLRRRDYIEP